MTNQRNPKVLVVVSAADKVPLREGGHHDVGVFLGELVEPTDAMIEAGFELTFVSPGGRVPTIDRNSYLPAFWGYRKSRIRKAEQSLERLWALGMRTPAELEKFAHDTEWLEQFDAIFVPGGHAPMVDLLRKDAFVSDKPNEDFGAMLKFFHDTGKTTCMICHAPAALGAAPVVDGKWLYNGYRMTTISMLSEHDLEDGPNAMIHGHIKEYPTELLEELGAIVEQTNIPNASCVVEDRELLTGQDPSSAEALGARFVAKVQAAVGA